MQMLSHLHFCYHSSSNSSVLRFRMPLICRGFLDKYCRVVRAGGEFHFKTDNAPLFEFSVEEFSACGLEVKNLTRNLHEHGIVGIMTGYEEKFHALGTPINRCEVVCKPFVLPPEEKKKASEEAL